MKLSTLKNPLHRCITGLCLALAVSAISGMQNFALADNLYPMEGNYEFSPGHRISMGVSNEFGNSLVWLDLKTLKVGQLVSVSDGVFKDKQETGLKFEFSTSADGVTSSLKLTQNNSVMTAKKIRPHVRQSISFMSEGRKLRGDLYLPAESGKHPVVVFAHGSGPSTRGVGPFTTFFLQLGIGVLTFDKQGAGESEGEWQTASFDSLATDVLAGIDYVKNRPEVDTSKIGVMGSSQGGWIGSMVAAKSKDLAFLLMRVGAGQNVRETMAHEKRGQYMAEGITDEKDLDEGVALYHAYWDVVQRGGSWEDGRKVFAAYSTKPWYKKAFGEERVSKTKNAELWWTWLNRNLNYDSYDYLKTVQVPVFWALAEKDWNVNSQKSYPRINAALKLAGNQDYTVKILPDMGHTGLVVKTGLPNEGFSWQYASGYWEGMESWLKERKIAR